MFSKSGGSDCDAGLKNGNSTWSRTREVIVTKKVFGDLLWDNQ